eukprot:m.140062 g.140062  ORF g.140062 m.140062 type:complete len:266 (+) comp14028_c0_seq4:349-1146(+)
MASPASPTSAELRALIVRRHKVPLPGWQLTMSLPGSKRAYILREQERLERCGVDVARISYCKRCCWFHPSAKFSKSQLRKKIDCRVCKECCDSDDESSRQPREGMLWCSRCRRQQLRGSFSQTQQKTKTDRERKCTTCVETALRQAAGVTCSMCRHQLPPSMFSQSQLAKKVDSTRKCRDCVVELQQHIADCQRIKEQEKVEREILAEEGEPTCFCGSLLWDEAGGVVQCDQCETAMHKKCLERADSKCPFCRNEVGFSTVNSPP